MTELLLNLDESHLGKFEKIAPSIYYSPKNQLFYRLSFLPSTVIFQDQQISQPHLATFTYYDPLFHIINLLLKKPVPAQQLHLKFKNINILKVADMKCDGTEEIYVLNKEKAYDFLEKKVEKLQECLSKRLGEKLLEVETSYMIKEKQIRDETVIILKSEIEDRFFIESFAKDRYNYQNVRKLAAYYEEPEETIPKKKVAKKQVKKEQKQRLQHGQKSLTAFFSKK